ncbi:hypothetical protein IAQ61_009057 [Plenodomus lingam]|uniref:uncharacterized protein n=1 Tax=Leptosphaeria maculans TaxID=5022 RepID=UPI003330CCD1|nr:hypothetical protein IAQ61_009057 [Plenodomus lingam]
MSKVTRRQKQCLQACATTTLGWTRWDARKSPKDYTGFITAPSKQAQDHLGEAKPPGCCWWARLGQVICGMGVKGLAHSKPWLPSVIAPWPQTDAFRTVAVWDACLSKGSTQQTA